MMPPALPATKYAFYGMACCCRHLLPLFFAIAADITFSSIAAVDVLRAAASSCCFYICFRAATMLLSIENIENTLRDMLMPLP